MLEQHDVPLADEIDRLETLDLLSRKPRRLPKPPKGAPIPTEDQVQKAVIKLVERHGGRAVAVENETKRKLGRNAMFARRARGVVAGTSDLFTFWKNGVCVPVECKRPGGAVRPEQDDFLSLMERLGFAAGIVCSVDEAEALFRRAGVIA
ncbi:VRR-NUC domain-containing protein [Roseomonas gilardii]|uniref:VRR-NUC domain-containing protein n=1 Tax=Roseomonas gilardii TaxID=257708 RepID=A0ABU3MJN0_9PROT|nr:VRR-NUC domain-containing protein [Roseomonas gilardii]MDT8333016.1 VRR-NUC domain-containing protein [Roseomonas gilardii]